MDFLFFLWIIFLFPIKIDILNKNHLYCNCYLFKYARKEFPCISMKITQKNLSALYRTLLS